MAFSAPAAIKHKCTSFFRENLSLPRARPLACKASAQPYDSAWLSFQRAFSGAPSWGWVYATLLIIFLYLCPHMSVPLHPRTLTVSSLISRTQLALPGI